MLRWTMYQKSPYTPYFLPEILVILIMVTMNIWKQYDIALISSDNPTTFHNAAPISNSV